MFSAASARAALWSTFSAKAELIGATIMHTGSPKDAAGLLAAAASGYACTASARHHFPDAVQLARAATRAPTADVVAAGVFAVAETGSVAIDEPADDRAACYLSEHLWLVVREAEIVPTIDIGLERIATLIGQGSRHPVLMSGPSRTADIERVLTVGVHGPRALTVVVVGNA